MSDTTHNAIEQDALSDVSPGKRLCRRLVVLDPGYGHQNAHHHSVNLALAADLSIPGAGVLILGSQELTAATINSAASKGGATLPWFNIPRYPDQAETLAAQAYEDLAHAFADQIVALFDRGIVHADAPVLMHTGFALHFYGLALALHKLRGRVRGHWIALTMFAPGAELRAEGGEQLQLEDGRVLLRYRLALKLLHSAAHRAGIKMVIASPSRAYQRTFQQLWPDPVALHPAVNYQPLCQVGVARDGGKYSVLLYLGCPKREKGVEFAFQLGMAVASRFPQIHLTFHFNAGFHGASRFDGQVVAFRHAGQKFNNVCILEGNLSQPEYDALLVNSDLICLLYDPAHYRLKTSGIFWDGLRCDHLAWLVTRSSWMDRELGELGIDAQTVEYGDVTGALACIERRMTNKTLSRTLVSPLNQEYRQQLCRPLGKWVLDVLESGNC